MKIRIIRILDKAWTEAAIEDGKKLKLPSFHEGWRFNFPKHSQTKGAFTYVLIVDETPETIEGCLIYKMRKNTEPYMAYIEAAPHNKGKGKKYDLVAGCLIAYACRLSFITGKGDYKGWLAFDVQEANDEDQHKLMSLYSKKYHAKRFGETTMLIMPEDGERLIGDYLENG